MEPVIDCHGIDDSSRSDLISQYPHETKQAEALYTGNEHEYVKEAVQELREIAEVEWRIISAGFGLIQPETALPSYECTFRDTESVQRRIDRMGYNSSSMTAAEQIQTVSEELGIQQEMNQILGDGFDVAFIVLGRDYLLATGDALTEIPEGTTAFAFAAEGNRDLIGDCQWVRSSETERDALSTVWTELKGLQLRNVASSVTSAEELEQLTAERIQDISTRDPSVS